MHFKFQSILTLYINIGIAAPADVPFAVTSEKVLVNPGSNNEKDTGDEGDEVSLMTLLIVVSAIPR